MCIVSGLFYAFLDKISHLGRCPVRISDCFCPLMLLNHYFRLNVYKECVHIMALESKCHHFFLFFVSLLLRRCACSINKEGKETENKSGENSTTFIELGKKNTYRNFILSSQSIYDLYLFKYLCICILQTLGPQSATLPPYKSRMGC